MRSFARDTMSRGFLVCDFCLMIKKYEMLCYDYGNAFILFFFLVWDDAAKSLRRENVFACIQFTNDLCKLMIFAPFYIPPYAYFIRWVRSVEGAREAQTSGLWAIQRSPFSK